MIAHMEEKPFNCDICHLFFTSQKNLDKHLEIHNNTVTKNYLCTHQGCFQRFREKDQQIQHERTHTGEKPYKCDHQFCSQSFT